MRSDDDRVIETEGGAAYLEDLEKGLAKTGDETFGIAPPCHPGSPTDVVFVSTHGALAFSCDECEEYYLAVKVARAGCVQ